MYIYLFIYVFIVQQQYRKSMSLFAHDFLLVCVYLKKLLLPLLLHNNNNNHRILF